jgi:ABC-type multidrug transport system ATPase subunit
LVLDEPTVGIDPQSRRFILKTLRRLNAEGTTLLYTSHYMEEVEQLCRYIATIDHGRILCADEVGGLLASGAGQSLQADDGEGISERCVYNAGDRRAYAMHYSTVSRTVRWFEAH